VRDAAAGATAVHAAPVVEPDEGDAGPGGRGAVRGGVVADVDGMAGGDAHRVESGVEDARVGLGVPAALGRHDGLEERLEAGGPETRPLDAVDPVRDDAEAVAAAERAQRRAAAREAVAAGGEPVEIGLAQPPRGARVAPDLPEEAPEALGGEGLLRRLAAPEGGPQLVVDPVVGGERRLRAREAEGREGLPQGAARGAVEVEEGVVDVEEDGAEAGQNGGYLAR
jgi:hypothetical protein